MEAQGLELSFFNISPLGSFYTLQNTVKADDNGEKGEIAMQGKSKGKQNSCSSLLSL